MTRTQPITKVRKNNKLSNDRKTLWTYETKDQKQKDKQNTHTYYLNYFVDDFVLTFF